MIYEPREDSFLLQKYVERYANGKVLDMGTGSGIQALTALKKTKYVVAVDIDKEAVEHVRNFGVKAVQSDLFKHIKGKFDLIIFNPPYLPNHKGIKDKTCDGGKKGNEIIKRFLHQAKTYMKKQGKILLVCSSLTPGIPFLFKKYNYRYKLLEEQSFFFEKLFVYLLKKEKHLS